MLSEERAKSEPINDEVAGCSRVRCRHRHRVISPAASQVYPSRPIKIVVPFPAGGAFDTIARILTEHMKVSLGQPVIIENVSGATGSVGVGRVARASPDGYTLSFGIWSTHVVNGAVYSLPYDVIKDFAPISLVATAPQIIVSNNAGVPATNLPLS